ncbi:MAG: hypothetical protein ACXV7J_06535 [Methylomonas sp.]
MNKKISRLLRLFLIMGALGTMTGCLEWLHAYQTYQQMDEFDRYFAVTSDRDFTVHFKKPKLLSDDFVALGKLRASSEEKIGDSKKWRYWFRKIDQDGIEVAPEISFYLEMVFDKEDKITEWTFSNLFLQIAPPEFLEASFRSLGGAEINEEKQQLRAKTDQMEKIAARLPKKAIVLDKLGPPLEVENQDQQEIYKYHFRLDARRVKEGYEDRTLSEIRLTFDKTTDELIKMSGRFAGLKISINYRNFQETDANQVAEN